MKKVEEMTINEALLAEFDAFGFYLSSHPLVNFTHKIAKYDIKSFKETEELRSQSISDIKLKMAGVITVVIHKNGTRGRFAFVKIGDLSNIFEVAIFSEEIITQNRDILKVGSVLVMNVTASMQENGSIRLLVNDIASIDNEAKIQQFKMGISQKSWQKKTQTPALEPVLQQKQDVQFLQCNKILIDAELFETHTNKPFNVLLEAIKRLDKGNTQVSIKLNGFNAELGISVKIPMEFMKRLGNSVKII